MVREAPRTAAWGQPGGSEHMDLPWKVDACLQATSQATVVRLVAGGQWSVLGIESGPCGAPPRGGAAYIPPPSGAIFYSTLPDPLIQQPGLQSPRPLGQSSQVGSSALLCDFCQGSCFFTLLNCHSD